MCAHIMIMCFLWVYVRACMYAVCVCVLCMYVFLCMSVGCMHDVKFVVYNGVLSTWTYMICYLFLVPQA